jgi:hypothetical protein
MITYIENINNLEIRYNSKKSIYPRLSGSKKRGKDACLEIMRSINSYFISKKGWLEELCWVLQKKINVDVIGSKKILVCNNEDLCEILFDENYHFISNITEAQNTIESVIETTNLKSIFINPVDYFKEHFQNMELDETQKIQLIKIILN